MGLSIRRPSIRANAAGIALPFLAAIIGGGTAAAQAIDVTETSTITNVYQYRFFDDNTLNIKPGNTVEVSQHGFDNDRFSEIDVGLTSFLDNGNFSFKHDGTCVGQCRVYISTNITFQLTNNGDQPVDLRFDSLITPGHLAFSNLDPTNPSEAFFNFTVRQDATPLYSAQGAVTDGEFEFDLPGGDFNEMIYQEGPGFEVVDWSATNLNLALNTIAPGQTSTLRYFSFIEINSAKDCFDPFTCPGFQVAFGDPRNIGQAEGFEVLSANTFSLFATEPDPLNPAVGSGFDSYDFYARVVSITDPLPPTPAPIGRITYDIAYLPPTSAIPEPESWALMLLGFGVIGGAMRRRGARALATPATA